MWKNRNRNFTFRIIGFIALICLAVIPAASAFTATQISPAGGSTSLPAGGTISIQINDLAVGNSFQYRLVSSALSTTGNTVTLSSVNMPFGFSAGTSSTSLSTTGLTSAGATLTVRRLSDSSEQILTGNPITSAKNIAADNYYISISGEKTGSTVGIDYSVSGTVGNAGTNPSTLSLTLSNVESGQLSVQVLEGSTTRFSQVFTILSTTPVPGTGQTDSDGGGSDTGSAAPDTPPSAPAAFSTTTATLQQNEEGQVLADYVIESNPSAGFSSSLNINTGTAVLSSTGQPVDQISITPLDPASVPDPAAADGGVFSFSGLSVECGPSGTQFVGGSATITFSLTPEQWADAISQVNGNTAAMTVQFYDTATQSWVDVPTTVDPITHTVTASVTHFSTFGLFYKTETESSPKTFGELIGDSSTSAGGATVTSVYTPVQAAVPASDSQMAPAETTPTPGFEGIAAIGALAIISYCVLRKNE